jgi:hypothetical protein
MLPIRSEETPKGDDEEVDDDIYPILEQNLI